jgi:DNA-binding response OmpR family regulator
MLSTHLLIAESKVSIRSAYEYQFSRAGFDVRSVGTLREALECADHVAFDAVIADAGLDAGLSVNGLALLSHLRSRHGRILPATVLTAYGWPECAALAATLCVDIFLHKPVSLPWLEGEIRARIAAIRLAARARGLVVTVPDAVRPWRRWSASSRA